MGLLLKQIGQELTHETALVNMVLLSKETTREKVMSDTIEMIYKNKGIGTIC